MNSNTQFLPLPDPAPQALNQPQPPDRPDPAAPKRGRSKIDRLPRHLRERLNQLMDDGVPYSRIPEQLGPEAAGITVSNLSDWFATGHQLWLKNQAWRDELHARMDAFQSLAANTNPTQLSRSGLLLSMLQICEQLRDLGPQVHQQQLQTDFNAYLRTLNTFARLSRSMIALLQFEQNSPPPPPDPLTEEEQRRLIIAKVDQILGLPPTRHPTAANPPPFTFNPQPPTCPAPQEQTSNINLAGLPPSEVQNQNPKLQNGIPDPIPQSVIETPKSKIPGEATPSSPIQNQKSEIENPVPSSPIQNQKSKIENPTAPPLQNQTPEEKPLTIESPLPNHPAEPTPSIENPKSKIANPQVAPLAIENPKSKIEIPENPGSCHACHVPLPPLRPDGKRPHSTCQACNSRLYPPGTLFDICQFCRAANPVPLNHQRADPDCCRCHNYLPPPGQRFVTRCPACGSSIINVTNTGQRVYERCPRCDAPISFLEPAPPPSLNPGNSS